MFQFVLRAAGLVTLALAVVLGVLDITRSISAGALVLTPLSQSLGAFMPNALSGLETSATAIHPFLWAPVATSLLALPSWLIVWLIAMVLLWSGERRTRPLGRFSSR